MIVKPRRQSLTESEIIKQSANLNQQILNVISNMVVEVYIEQTISCQGVMDVSQKVIIESIPYGPGRVDVNVARVVEGNAACVMCIEQIGTRAVTTMNNWIAHVNSPNKRAFPTLEQFVEQLLGEVQGCAPQCKSCTVSNVTQALNWELNQDCMATVGNNTTFYDSLSEKLFQKLVADKDTMAQVVTAFAAAFGEENVVRNIATMLTNVTQSMRDDSHIMMDTLMQSTQNLQVQAGGGGTFVNRVSQNATAAVMVSAVYDSIKDIDIVNKNNVEAVQDLVDKNATLKDIFNTIGNIGKTWIDELSGAAKAGIFTAIGIVVLVIVIWLGLALNTFVQVNKSLEGYRAMAAKDGAAEARATYCGNVK